MTRKRTPDLEPFPPEEARRRWIAIVNLLLESHARHLREEQEQATQEQADPTSQPASDQEVTTSDE
jgi:hypothetical protein